MPLAGSDTRYKEITRFGTIPDYILVDAGINDIEFGTQPAVSTLQGYLVTLINKIRSEAGFAAVPIYIEAIKTKVQDVISGMLKPAIDSLLNLTPSAGG